MTIMSSRLGAGFVLALQLSCARASDENEAKRTPSLPPPAGITIPRGLSIAVTIDGNPAPALTAARLGAATPTYVDNEHRAWTLASLLPAFDTPGATLEARGPSGISVRLERPVTTAALQPVLFLTRRGDVVVSVVDPGDPFPPYHGQGGRLRRQGDPLPRLSPVASIAITHAPAP
jgi:hypothetical protein